MIACRWRTIPSCRRPTSIQLVHRACISLGPIQPARVASQHDVPCSPRAIRQRMAWWDTECTRSLRNPRSPGSWVVRVIIRLSSGVGCISIRRIGLMAIRIEPRLSPISIRAPMRRLWNINFPASSALFFHGNTFHSSEANVSEKPRRSYICCYNALSNVPYTDNGHGKPVPITMAPDDAILRFGAE